MPLYRRRGRDGEACVEHRMALSSLARARGETLSSLIDRTISASCAPGRCCVSIPADLRARAETLANHCQRFWQRPNIWPQTLMLANMAAVRAGQGDEFLAIPPRASSDAGRRLTGGVLPDRRAFRAERRMAAHNR